MAGLPYTGGEAYNSVKTTTFADVPLNHMFWKEIEAFYNAGITTGCCQNPLRSCPLNLVTRQEMAVFIVRAFIIPLP